MNPPSTPVDPKAPILTNTALPLGGLWSAIFPETKAEPVAEVVADVAAEVAEPVVIEEAPQEETVAEVIADVAAEVAEPVVIEETQQEETVAEAVVEAVEGLVLGGFNRISVVII